MHESAAPGSLRMWTPPSLCNPSLLLAGRHAPHRPAQGQAGGLQPGAGRQRPPGRRLQQLHSPLQPRQLQVRSRGSDTLASSSCDLPVGWMKQLSSKHSVPEECSTGCGRCLRFA